MREDEAYAQMGGCGGERVLGSVNKLCGLSGGLN